MEDLALEKAQYLDKSAEDWSDHERRMWLEAFWRDLGPYLYKWKLIRMMPGPGESITFEIEVCK
jgi:hypothetical protein